ncbi:3-hydroxyacyl-CoA dehydrogenase NAD-binding domain-containing protein [Alloalcanivorax profundimaris]|uniref:3-hydroxyacyl-CoA dehydrogenase NAD-binding domain-containing protein n=1 Tax=Alloalcanivorax profundimaris TaxID=2735259 RepID=UPI000C39B2AE|nr:3-hydroxyacyl-CoA dehydrogenase NAD-binding domain-containing protein [Alloalcanivorax profundimaris]MAY11674.1 3-hydroxyacyl-CoA dehydrogenase [Alcanivorax sp.]MBF1801182.1 3-hydroxyacyl-CoA dehydrogenase [Alloalcanivorax profundimaris]MBM1142819.1 enoyl-CoA hydratase/isomerase family protein [Alcanivorax sp. ZXX171]HCE41017.1 3-hydroxyacyl-CoA dehydrogenase [Alcanivorax sp.]|tara:strand:- start:49129 stop:51213 length:2085 start_codon:yes stop_codon:yes gene_type:complete
MSDLVSYRLEGDIGVISVNYPPVNALGQGVREGLVACLRQGLDDDQAKALVVIGEGRTFPAGADIREFGKPPQGPALPDVVAEYEASDKLVVAAIHGTALGGGLEVALGCDYRVALDSAKVGLPEVKLGILPGAGGTQRLPRLIGAQKALEVIVAGNPVKAKDALELGIVDELIGGDLLEGALAFARKLAADNAPLRRIRDLQAKKEDPDLFSNFEKSIARKQRGFKAPFHCIKAVQAAVELPFDEGMKRERELFAELLVSPESRAQRHVFFAEREVAKVPGLPKDTPKRDINQVAVIGAGTMGGGIAMNFANAGIPVKILEVKEDALEKGIAVIRKNYENTAKKGRITAQQVEDRMALIQPTLSYDDLSDVDLVIEAVFENMDVKKAVFSELDRVCKPGAILATNTSTLDVNRIAEFTQRPEDVMGMHFFSPANVMKLLENVRGEKTADDVVATVMDLSRRIGKVGVLVGVCHGFVGNRMLHKRQAEAIQLVNEGASPAQVDKVLFDLGFPMGPFAMSDLAGMDVGYRIREELRKEDPDNAPPRNWTDELVEQGRLGQKTQAGVFDYKEGDRTPVPSSEVDALIAKFREEQGIQAREVSDQEILERCMYVMVNEGAKILEEGIAARPLDVDVIWIYGYGFPVYRGGVLFWADSVGVKTIYDKVSQFHKETGNDVWKPAALLEKLANEGKGFYG